MNISLNAAMKVPILAALSEDTVAAGLREGRMIVRKHGRGEIIHLDGDACSHVEFILSGQAVVERIGESGDLMTVAEFESNDILGGSLIFSSRPRYPMTVTALTETTLLAIGREDLFSLCAAHPAFLRLFLVSISDNALRLGVKLRNHAKRTLRESLMEWLKAERVRQGGDRIALPASKTVLAERFGVQRTSLSRELQRMRQEGLIDFDAESITLRNMFTLNNI